MAEPITHVPTYRRFREDALLQTMESCGCSRADAAECADAFADHAEYLEHVGGLILDRAVTGAAVRNICAMMRSRADAGRYFGHHRCVLDCATFDGYWTRRESRDLA